ncbi:hypothetical protein GOBAR_AA25940 [Gossypium barbadense]|uniref:GATA-type domain-containing protein n=1 Tax=Gossypium barbadense TaxID=3634 RepID=A0A2P5WUG1_GOSBA|nr:hypothetical protein GOBAR_AA25940 [Gossypium barbadense]
MNNSWFNKCFDGFGVNDGLFDDLVKYLDFPLEDVEGTDDDGASGEEHAAYYVHWCSHAVIVWYMFLIRESKQCDESSELNQLSGITKASSSRSTTTLNGESVDVKGSTWFQTSSPVSVLETSSACSSAKPAPINPKLSFLVKRDRSKRRRASTFNLQFTLPFISSTGSTSLVGSESESESHLTEKSAKKRQKKKNLTWLSGSSENDRSSSEEAAVVRKCTHCEVTKTPQWREGPKGPKTLCNACGVRYRSGRLFPEYRPAASPTFVASLHSNSHKKVIEMRKQCQTAEVGNTIYGVNSTRNSNRIDY